MSVDGPADAPALVFSNALGTGPALWDAQVAALSGSFRIATYDHPPLHSVPALGAALLGELDRAGIRSASFCGLSLGAMVSMWIAAEAPWRVQRLVLACTAARFGVPAEWEERADLVRAEGMESVAHDALDAWFTPAYRDREPFLQMQLETPPEEYARGLEAIGSFDFRSRLGEIEAPTLVIAGALDPATTPADAELIAAGISDAKLLVIDGAAHLANVERPTEFTQALTAHLSA